MYEVKTNFTNRVLIVGTLEDCLSEVKNFYASDLIGSLTIYKDGSAFAYIKRANSIQCDFIVALV